MRVITKQNVLSLLLSFAAKRHGDCTVHALRWVDGAVMRQRTFDVDMGICQSELEPDWGPPEEASHDVLEV